MLVAPLSLLGLLLGKKKKRGKWELVVVILVLGISLGMSLTACNFETTTPTETVNIEITPTTPTPSATVTVTATATITSSPTPTGPPIQTPTLTATCTVTSTPMPDVLDETKLKKSNLYGTRRFGLEYYEWYKDLFEDKDFWWWEEHTTFSTWDLFTIVIHAELAGVGNPNSPMYQGFSIYKEAVVRAAYVWCNFNYPIAMANEPEGALNWLAEYSESGKARVKNGVPEKLTLNPYESAEEITSAIRNPQTHGILYWDRLMADLPIGVGNKDLYESGDEYIRFKKAEEYDDNAKNLGQSYKMFAWRSGRWDPREVLIPNGCGNKLLSGESIQYEFMACGSGIWPEGVPYVDRK